ncbi:histone-like nucleoid-structuring protein Lsr2 [Williamsia sp. DF01-3]|uniref:Lsr2 family DNA-binding protein n=1 Tax=Williamsia sp. DF01-3 TaxID=2934157 RepID=UPI001FF2B643|nr:histone-like nucleoid-structuring protein Lsr2 [Williamsia sp. DF01-3]MCK0515919.1 Lsr2 family protein [Williamsia sp. DF01-3]
MRWSWLGVDYHLDTSTANLEKIEAGQVSLATVLAKSTRIGGRARSTAPKHHPRPDTPPPADGGVRVWARRQGYDIAERGRIPVAITRAYNDAH